MTKPSILIIPGSFSYAELYDTLVDALAQRGYDVRALDLPSVLRPGAVARPPATMYDDAAHIARETERLADEGRDVILVPHSYGGVPTSESVRGLAKQERRTAGKAGGLVRVAYMTCLVGVVGQGTVQTLADVPDEQKIELKVDVCRPSPSVERRSH
jgi:pimeloyl-ACP methyl ester carboxylesterase